MKVLIKLAQLYAAVGFGLAVVVHVVSFYRAPPGGQTLWSALNFGLLPLVWFTFFARPKLGHSARRDFKAYFLTYSPKWLNYITLLVMVYGFAVYIYFQVLSPNSLTETNGSLLFWRGWSGNWMALFCLCLWVYTIMGELRRRGAGFNCPNGHEVSRDDAFCSTCGSKIQAPSVAT